MELDNAISYLMRLRGAPGVKEQNLSKIREIISLVLENEFLEFCEEIILDNFRQDLKKRIIPRFCKNVIESGVDGLLPTVTDLHENISWYFQIILAWPNPYQFSARLHEMFISCFFWDLDSKIKNIFAEFYSLAFQVDACLAKDVSVLGFNISMDEDESVCDGDHIIVEWEGRSRKIQKDDCGSIINNNIATIVRHLFDLDLVFSLAEQPISKVLEVEIKRYIKGHCAGRYEKEWLTELNMWRDKVVLIWLDKILKKIWLHEQPLTNEFACRLRLKTPGYTWKEWTEKPTFILYETYTELRIAEMLPIITDYPESSRAIEDLKYCIEKTNKRPYLIEVLRNELSDRVLHLGVSTPDIITVYINAVKALRLLDPSGVVMEIVLEKYTNYLISREDTVRRIVTGLLDYDKDNELSVELAESGRPIPVYTGDNHHSFHVELITKQYEDWVPDPREADPEKTNRFRRTSDIISLLVSMYGCTKVFIEEYQKLLSKRLLSNWFSGTSEDTEIKNLELLKLRFGETDMEKCAVMLKDVADSRRINTCINVDEAKYKQAQEIEVNTLIISSEYWPEFNSMDLILPADAVSALDLFNKAYEGHKASRALHWVHSESRVDIELELKDRTIKLQVTPLLASVISLFQDKETWALEDISDEIKATTSMVRRNIVFWLQQGILRETSPETYTLVEDQGSSSLRSYAKTDLESIMKEEEDEKDDMETAKQKQQELILWNYIRGMLTNFDSLPLDRISKMLRMFAMHDPSMQMDQTKLRTFLNSKIQAGVLCIDGGKYKLNKDA